MICVGILGLVVCLRHQRLPVGRGHLKVYSIAAICGTVLPNTASFTTAVHLPAGILSILISTVPMFAFPIALLFGIERFSWRRVAGLCLGLVAILLLAGPETSLPDRMAVIFIQIAPIFYAFESNYVAKWGLGGSIRYKLCWAPPL